MLKSRRLRSLLHIECNCGHVTLTSLSSHWQENKIGHIIIQMSNITHRICAVSHHYQLFLPDFLTLFLSISDGLIDCVDPDCCEQLSCGSDPLCRGSADPMALLQRSPLPPTAPASPINTHTYSFYRCIHFLLGKAATHALPGDVPFDTRYALVYSLWVWVTVCMRNHSLIFFLWLCPWIVHC